jgi:sugar O-acyltransferase (sialic acid O-acetyltransferase NeuD family)
MKVIFIGAANPETIRMIESIKRVSPEFHPCGFIDNDSSKFGTSFHGIPILGGIDFVPTLLGDDVRFVNLITGSTTARYLVTLDAVSQGAILTNFIHPSVDLTMTRWGVGNYIQEGVITQAEVEVGDNSSIHMGSLIGHESKIGNSVFIAHAVSISGCCEIGDGCFIGTNATVLPRTKIGKWSTVGAGAVVTKDIPDYSVVVGNPARVIRKNDVPYNDGKVLL